MSIFDSIKNAIFGHKAAAAPAPAPTSAPSGAPVTPAAPQAPAPASQPVDVEAVLNAAAAKNTQKLNWRTPIVDLMKLLDLDSSITNRKALAKELGYTGSTEDSAAMNIWLHKQVMTQLAQNGGTVPADLRA